MARKKKLRTFDTIKEGVDILGGTMALAELYGTYPSAISNMIADGRFPSHAYLWFRAEFERAGYELKPDLCGMKPPRETGTDR